MRTLVNVVVVFVTAICTFAQNAAPPRSPLDATNWGVVYDHPAAKTVKLRTDVKYSGDLAIDIYSPADAKTGAKLPAVIFLNAIGDRPDNKVKSWEIYKTWPRLIAADGMVGISMDADGMKIQDSLRALFDFLAKDGAKHGIDADRLGVYAASANTTQSLVYLMSAEASKGIKAAALFYGNSPAPNTQIRKDLPVLYILAEGDAAGFFGQQAGGLWQRVMEAKAPWTLTYASDLPHAFDAFTDNDKSRRIIQQAIAFWQTHLEPVPQPGWKPSDERAIVDAIYWNDPSRSIPLLSKYLEKNPNDVTAHMQIARAFQQSQRMDEALVSFEKVKSMQPSNPTGYAGIGQIKFSQRRYEDAAANLTAAIDRGFRTPILLGQLAFSQLALQQNEEAIRTYEQAFQIGIPRGPNTSGVAYYNMACAYTRLKNYDKAFEMLGKAIDEGYVNRQSFETDSDLAALRTDARFQTLLERLPKAGS